MKIYFTITGMQHYLGNDFLEKGMKVKLVKEPDNSVDREAIMVKFKGLGKIGYVANSVYTVLGECYSAGRIYDRIGKKAKGKVIIKLPNAAICELTDDGLTKKSADPAAELKPQSNAAAGAVCEDED